MDTIVQNAGKMVDGVKGDRKFVLRTYSESGLCGRLVDEVIK